MRHQTYSQKNEEVVRNWQVVDAAGQVLGRMATRIAVSLRGKDKPTFTPHIDGGDFVVVVNAEKVTLTGAKLDGKKYSYYTGYRGGLKTSTARQLQKRKPEELIRLAVQGMLPKGPLGRQLMTKLKIYTGPEHPHAAQKPVPMEIRA